MHLTASHATPGAHHHRVQRRKYHAALGNQFAGISDTTSLSFNTVSGSSSSDSSSSITLPPGYSAISTDTAGAQILVKGTASNNNGYVYLWDGSSQLKSKVPSKFRAIAFVGRKLLSLSVNPLVASVTEILDVRSIVPV